MLEFNIFWFTGWIVWVIFSVCIAASIIIGLIAGVIKGYSSSKMWASLKIIDKTTTHEERAKLRRSCPLNYDEEKVKIIDKWLKEFYYRKDSSSPLCRCLDPRTVWNETSKQWMCEDCGGSVSCINK